MERYDDIHRIVSAAYANVDAYVDNFAKTRHIASDLLLGTPPVEKPFLSVLIPTYRRTELLRQAVESVLAQRDVPFAWEILVVDNTPPDTAGVPPALTVLQDLSVPNLRYYHNWENLGSGYNWNRAVELAQGKWVCFLHDDDLMFPDALQNLARILHQADGGKKPLGYVQARRIEFTSSTVPTQPKKLLYLLPLTRRGALLTGYTGTENPSCGTTILRKAYLRTGGINYDFGPSADAVLGYQIMKDYRVLCSDAYLGAYRWQENESLRADTAQRLIEADALFAQYRYRQSKGATLWGKLFGDVQKEKNIRLKIRIADRGANLLTRAQLSASASPPPTWKIILYTVLVYAYQAARRLGVMVLARFVVNKK